MARQQEVRSVGVRRVFDLAANSVRDNIDERMLPTTSERMHAVRTPVDPVHCHIRKQAFVGCGFALGLTSDW